MGVRGIGAGDQRLVLDNALQSQNFAAEEKRVARRQHLDEIFLDLAKHAPAAAQRAGIGGGAARAAGHEAHFQHIRLDDRADIEPVGLRDAPIGDAPASVRHPPDPGEALIALERIAAGRDESERGVEIFPRQFRVRRGRAHLGEEVVGVERRGAGHAEDVLAEHVERAGAGRRRVLRALARGVDGGAAFQHLETVGGNKNGAAMARRAGDWRGRCAGRDGSRPSARRH